MRVKVFDNFVSATEALLENIRKAQKEIAETQLELRAQLTASKKLTAPVQNS